MHMTVDRDHFCISISPFKEPQTTVDVFFPCRGSTHLPEPLDELLTTLVDILLASVREAHRTGVQCQCEKFYHAVAAWGIDFLEFLDLGFDKV